MLLSKQLKQIIHQLTLYMMGPNFELIVKSDFIFFLFFYFLLIIDCVVGIGIVLWGIVTLKRK